MGSVADATVTLFTFPHSRFAQSVRIALEEKGIPYVPVDVDFDNKPKLLLEANPIHQKVPTIIHNGKAVAESLIILHYLEEEWPKQVPWLPEDAHERSQVRFWADYIYNTSGQLMKAWLSEAGSAEKKAAAEESVKFLKTLEKALTTFSADGPFFTGVTFGFLDAVAAPLLNLVTLAEKLGGLVVPGPDETPRLHKTIEAIVARPSYKSAIPSKEEALQFFPAFVQKRRAAREAAVAVSVTSSE